MLLDELKLNWLNDALDPLKRLGFHKRDHSRVVDGEAKVGDRAGPGRRKDRAWPSAQGRLFWSGTLRKPKAWFCTDRVELLNTEACHWNERDGCPLEAVAIPCGGSCIEPRKIELPFTSSCNCGVVGVDAHETAAGLEEFRYADVRAKTSTAAESPPCPWPLRVDCVTDCALAAVVAIG